MDVHRWDWQLQQQQWHVNDAIGKANATINVTPYSVTFDDGAHTATGSATGVESSTPADLTSLLHLDGATHTDAGDYPADSWTFDGNGNYNSASGTVHDVITKATSTTSVTCPASTTYTGSAIEPCSVTVTGVGGLSLTPTPTYTNNTNVGTANASYTYAGDANHTSSSDSKNFEITKASSTVTVTCPGTPQTYTGAAQTPCTAEATGVGMSPVDVSGSLVYGNNTNVGTATADASWAGDANHTSSSGSSSFTIGKYTFNVCDGSNNCTGGTTPNTDGIGGSLTITSSVSFKGSAMATVNLSPASLGGADALTSPGTDPNPPHDPLPPNFKVWIAPVGSPTAPVLFGSGVAIKTAPDIHGISAWHTDITSTLDGSLVPGSYLAYVYGDDGATLTSNAVTNDAGYVNGDTSNLVFPTLVTR